MRRKVAVVTGGSRGIGRQVCIALARAGYDIAVNYHSGKTQAEDVCAVAEQSGARALPFYADVAQVDDLREMYTQVIRHFGEIDVVVNNAGISSEVYFLDATETDFDTMTAVDWKGVFFSTQIAARHMMERNIRGVIINISSNQVVGCWPRATIYGPTKAAVSKFTRNAAMELSRKGIRVVEVAPGYTDVGWEPGDIRLKAAERLPLRRFASVEEIAQGVVYLASEQAAYITGSTLTIDGGATLPVVAANDFV